MVACEKPLQGDSLGAPDQGVNRDEVDPRGASPDLWISTLEGVGVPVGRCEMSRFRISRRISAKTVPVDSLCFADEAGTGNDAIRSMMN